MHTIFTYGTLTIESIMQNVTEGRYTNMNALLNDYARFRVRHESSPGIVPRQGSSVEGKLYFGINDAALEKLDVFEGDLYERVIVHVKAGDGTTHKAFTYRIKHAYSNLVTGDAWDIEKFKKEHMRSFRDGYQGFEDL